MPRKLRPTGLGSGIDKDRQDFTIYSGDWPWGASTSSGGPESMRWFWSPMTRSDCVATLEEAKAQFQKSLGRLEGVGEAGRGRLNDAA
jgi:hypothetical protein